MKSAKYSALVNFKQISILYTVNKLQIDEFQYKAAILCLAWQAYIHIDSITSHHTHSYVYTTSQSRSVMVELLRLQDRATPSPRGEHNMPA